MLYWGARGLPRTLPAAVRGMVGGVGGMLQPAQGKGKGSGAMLGLQPHWDRHKQGDRVEGTPWRGG